MNGDSTANSLGHYGTQGVFDSLNTPPALYEACEWTDKNGNFWLFGGTTGFNDYGDLWEFNPSINQWAWIKGPGITNQPGIYGTQGISSPTNNPGCRAWGVPTWVDTSGNLWLFGGAGFDINGGESNLNDLWEYNISANEWTWIKGSDTINNPGVYGIIGIENLLNHPGARYETNATWTDNNNNLWLFGGKEINPLHGVFGDLWKYNITNNAWTWMNGTDTINQLAIYGTFRIPDTLNTPGGRACYSTWIDKNGDLWLFAGSNLSSSQTKNDMWKYNIATKTWTWMSGTNLNLDTIGVNGNKCDSNINNVPKSRYENRARWTLNCDNFVTFGGTEDFFTSNDLWNYSVSTNEWTWIGGSVVNNQGGIYGSKTISSPINVPGSRFGSVSWKDIYGNLWMFGGNNSILFNDMWRFVPDTTCPVTSCILEGIKENLINKSEIIVYPDPVSSISILQIQSNLIGKVIINFYDILGQDVLNIESENHTITINRKDFNAGMFFYRVSICGEVLGSGKFVTE